MKKLFILFLIVLFFVNTVYSLDVTIYHDEKCGACKSALNFLHNISEDYNLTVNEYEISSSSSNRIAFEETLQKFNSQKYGVPTIVIGNDELIVGFSDRISQDIIESINRHSSKQEIKNQYIITEDKTETEIFVFVFELLFAVIILLLLLKVIFGNKKRK
ncbi:hypothetical protein JXM83_05065 [Candidatus Woesearchaeota archaeon]|nr:hypothetical protein [Candidatus Woesearchaeota archaeon]